MDPIVLQAQNRAHFQNFSVDHLVDGVYTSPSTVNYGNYRVGGDRDLGNLRSNLVHIEQCMLVLVE